MTSAKDTDSILNSLKKIIFEQLSPLINNNYIFLDLPYYTNIGDTLIYKGTEEFLKTLPYKCLYKTAIETYHKPKISKEVIILLQGGGNFGDIWRRHTEFCLRIINEFPENRIIILPQTVFYKDKTILKADAYLMSKHPKLTICARDSVTHQLLKTFFPKNNILLVPDMAFYISQTHLNKYRKPEQNRELFFKRKDKEFQTFDYKNYLGNNNGIEEHEWPSMERKLFSSGILNYLKRIHSVFKKFNYINFISAKITDWYAVNIYMPRLIKTGIRFLSRYQYIYTTRLHGAILSILLQKPITFFDNSYGKNSSFYNTWLKDLNDIIMVEKEIQIQQKL
ncbi:MAG: polysaccharide pyruvyl transferase family protein [Bacteroidota bacterium]